MVERGEHHIMPDETTVAQCHAAMILKMATGVDEDVAPDGDILAEIGVERRKHLEGLVHGFAEQMRHQHTQLLL